jgi:hypothetical protein
MYTYEGLAYLTLEHDNAYVRTGATAAIADAVEYWPQAIHNTLAHLYVFYHEKVSECRFFVAQK